jgi:hypothetical protein
VSRGSLLVCLAAAHRRLVGQLPPHISRIRQISNTFEVHEAPCGSRLRCMRQACEVHEALVEGGLRLSWQRAACARQLLASHPIRLSC